MEHLIVPGTDNTNNKESNSYNFLKVGCDDINDNLHFDNLDASEKFTREKAIKPVFFVPGPAYEADNNNFLDRSSEPFSEVVLPSQLMCMDFTKTAKSIRGMASDIMSQAEALFNTNVNIIFDNNLLYHVTSLLTKEKYLPEVMAIYNKYIPRSFTKVPMINAFETMAMNYKNPNKNDEYLKVMVDMFTDTSASVSSFLGSNVYRFINESLTSGYLNPYAKIPYGDIIESIEGVEDDEELVYIIRSNNPDYDSDESRYFVVTKALLEIASFDLKRILEILELILVGAFYKFSDLLDYAVKNNIDMSINDIGF